MSLPPHSCRELPDLSPDIWRLIAAHLTIRDLSALSQTCRKFYRAVVTEDLFRYFYLERTGNAIPPSVLTDAVSWANLYRRSYGMRHAPTLFSHRVLLAGPLRIVACVVDAVILFSEPESKLFGYPVGWQRDVRELCDHRADLMQCCVQVPEARIGFVQSKDGVWVDRTGESWSIFKTIDARTGSEQKQVSLPIGRHGLRSVCTEDAMPQPKLLLLGGHDGQCLVYFVENGDIIRIVQRTTGIVMRNFRHPRNSFARLVRGVFRETGSFLIVGVVEFDDLVRHDGQKKYRIWSFESDEPADEFCIQEREELVDVVRSRDAGVTAYRVAKGGKGLTIWRQELLHSGAGSRTEDKGKAHVVRWPIVVPNTENSSLLVASEEFGLSWDGRSILLLPRFARTRDEVRSNSRVLRATFDKQGSLWSIESIHRAIDPPGPRWTWATVCMDSRILLACAQPSGLIAAFDLQQAQRLWSKEVTEGMTDVVLIAEHYLVGIGAASSKIYVWHFDAFCCTALSTKPWTVGQCVSLFSDSPELDKSDDTGIAGADIRTCAR